MKIVAVSDIPAVTDNKLDLFAMFSLCEEMKRLCIANNGVGLSAVQVGVPYNIFVAIKEVSSKTPFRYLVDCAYSPIGEEKVQSIEGCLSVRNLNGESRIFKVSRYKAIHLVGKEILTEDKLKLVEIDEQHHDELAIVYQHEIDHALGIRIDQIGEEIYIY